MKKPGVGLLLLLLCCSYPTIQAVTSSGEVDVSAGQVDKQWPSTASTTSQLNNAVYDDVNQNIYVGSVNWILVLNETLHIKKSIHVGPKPDNINCSPDYRDPCGEERTDMNSTILALALDQRNNVIIACSDRYYGYCFKVSLKTFLVTEEIYIPIVSNQRDPVVIVGTGIRAEGVMYVGTTHGEGLPLYKDRVPMLAVRELDGFNIAHVDTTTASSIDLLATYRESFKVKFIHAFTHRQYTYFLVVRRDNPESSVYKTKIIRLCHKDERFQSYIEMGLECQGYNLLQDAWVGKPGKKLGTTLGLTPTQDMIFATFAEATPGGSATAGSRSAVCSYSMAIIEEKFLTSIKMCFQGQGKIGPAHLTTPVQCTRMTDFPIGLDYCMEADLNYPIESGGKVDALAQYPVEQPLTSITVKVISDSILTLVVLGTRTGKVLQASIEDHESMTIFLETSLDSSLPVHRDMFLDKSQDHVYAMTSKQMSRVHLTPDCSQYESCGACLGAKNPHCGWCSLESSCVRRRDCSKADSEYGWLAYNHNKGCPVITKQEPLVIQYEYSDATMITLFFSFIPHELQTMKLNCAVIGYEEQRITRATLDLMANKIICDPFKSAILPNFPEGAAHLDMKLSVLIYRTPWISSNITFYDCSQLTSCLACASTPLECDWCLEGNECLPKSSKCLKQNYSSLRIRRQAPPTAVAISPSDSVQATPNPQEAAVVQNETPGTRVKDPLYCPLIKADKKQFLTPAGYTAKLSVYATSLRDFQQQNLKCIFDIGPGLVVNATSEFDSPRRHYVIECQPTTFDYPGNEPYVDVPFDVSWDAGKYLDNPSKINVRTFRCSAMVSSCGLCSLLEPVYKCGWCGNLCLQKEECLANNTWLPREATCPNPKIIEFSPTSGSVNGGTNITIQGINLGKRLRDLTSVKVAGIPCKVIEAGFMASQSFVCVTAPCLKGDYSGTIEVTIDNSTQAISVGKFTYVDPVLADFSPQRGPVSGGTHVIISGEYLNLGSKIVVSINAKNCPVVKRNFTHLEFLTAPQDQPLEGKVKVTVDGSEDNILGGRFTYVVDPEVQRVHPYNALMSGGTNVTVKGRNLDSIQSPKLLIKITGLNQKTAECMNLSSTKLVCPLPSLLGNGWTPTSSHPEVVNYGLVMDGVLSLRNLSYNNMDFEPFQIYPDPIIEPIPMTVKYTEDMTLELEGQNLKVFKFVPDLSVLVGNEPCVITELHDERMSCKPAAKVHPDYLDKDGNAHIEVRHGLLISNIGRINYSGRGTASTLVIILSVLGGIILIGFIVVAVLLIRREKRRRIKKTMPRPPDEIRSTRFSDDADRYNDRGRMNGGERGATASEMLPLKATEEGEGPFFDTADHKMEPGKPFHVEELLERVKNKELKTSIKEVLIPRERLDLGDIIGRGHFGCVYAAYLRDESLDNPEKVAVKTLQAYSLADSFSQQSVELFLKEGVTMRNFDHLHVLRLLGVCFDEEAQPMVILPYMAKGDLRSYVKDKTKNFTARQLLMLGRQVAEGMSYLASLNFVHRDLAARNCMIDENDQVKVADFGLSRELYEKDYYKSKDLDRKGKMPIKWMALESLEDFVFTTKSDVWSFGVLMWELMMRGVTPYPDVDVFDVRNFLASGRRLRKPKYCPDNIYQIMLDCWNALPILRPSFTDLVNRIELMLNPTAARSPKPAAEEEDIYMNLAKTSDTDYLHPVDNADGSVAFRPS